MSGTIAHMGIWGTCQVCKHPFVISQLEQKYCDRWCKWVAYFMRRGYDYDTAWEQVQPSIDRFYGYDPHDYDYDYDY